MSECFCLSGLLSFSVLILVKFAVSETELINMCNFSKRCLACFFVNIAVSAWYSVGYISVLFVSLWLGKGGL